MSDERRALALLLARGDLEEMPRDALRDRRERRGGDLVPQRVHRVCELAHERERDVGVLPRERPQDVRVDDEPRRLRERLRVEGRRSACGCDDADHTTAAGARVGYAPFVLRPNRLGEHRVAVVMPTQTWQAYNFRDDNGDGQPDTKAELLAYLSSVPTCGSSDGLDCFNSPTGRGPLLDIDSTGDALNHYLGKPTPDWQGSLGANFRPGHSWSINTLFEYKVGKYAVSDLTDAFRMSNPLIGRNLVDAAKTEALLDNPASTPEQRLQALVNWAYKYKSLSPYSGLHLTQNGDFMRFRELGITYTAPQSFAQKLGLRNLSFNAAGRNVALWTGYTGIDPEANAVGVGDGSQLDQNYLDAVDAWGFPLPRSFTFSVRFGF